jgi:hypothetical protein
VLWETKDIVSLAAVISTGSVALATLVINAATKRGDRKHGADLAYSKRYWDAKNRALLRLINGCSSIVSLCPPPGGERDPKAMLTVWRALLDADLNSEENAAVAAYGSNEVLIWLRDLRKLIFPTARPDLIGELHYLREVKRAATDKGDFTAVDRYNEREQEVLAKLEPFSLYLDTNGVKELCNKIIGAARTDLITGANLRMKPLDRGFEFG